ncbi:MAG TPA: hypothetical protein VMU54_03475 [Planctomycetota bacterium]|nr:hypothetical protein [Planctomycetota bacterium]
MNPFLMQVVAVVPPRFGRVFHEEGTPSFLALGVIVTLLLLTLLLRPRQGRRVNPEAMLGDLQKNDRVFIGSGFYRVERLANPKTRDLTLCVEERQRLHILVKPSEILSGPPRSRPQTSRSTPPDSESPPPKRPEGLAG